MRIAAVALLWLIGCVAQPEGAATTIILVRHAEKAAEPADDPALTEAGRRRAEELARVMEKVDVAAIYCTQYRRTLETVQPFATRRGLPIAKLDAGKLDEIARRLISDHPGRFVLFAGHSGTLPALIEKLGGPHVAPITDADYDNLFVITRCADGTVRLKQRKYGASK